MTVAVEQQSAMLNRLLGILPADSFARLKPDLEPVDLPLGTVLGEADQPSGHVYFLESGLASIVATILAGSAESEQIEVGHIGWEGMAGTHVVLGVDRTPNRTFMQVPGHGLRIGAARLGEHLATDAALRALLLKFVHCYAIQVAHSALANARFSMSERLARWLLMCHDRMAGDALPLTHEFLSLMLGVRRSGVTNALHVLEGAGIIRNTRGSIHVRDRAGMEALAHGCYGVPEREYERLVGISGRALRPVAVT